MNKIILWLIIIGLVIVGAALGYQRFAVKKELPYELATVIRGDIIEEVSETGTVKKGEVIGLSFKAGGKIEKIYVKVGENIKTGQNLAKLDISQLSLQLREAQAALEVAKAKKADAQVSLENAERDLGNIEEKAEEDLNNTYEDALTVLDDAYLKIYNSFNLVYEIQKTYFTIPSGDALIVMEKKDAIERALKKTETQVRGVKDDPRQENIDSALSNTKETLENVRDSLKVVRDIAGGAIYRDLVSSADKSSLDTQKQNINSVLGSVINTQQNISTIKITNSTNIDAAQAKVSALKAQLEPDGLYQAQINQAQLQISLLEKQIQEAILESPVNGQVTDLKKREGEIVQSAETVISLLPTSPFQIEVDIYEEDIAKIKVDNPVDITLAAFPEKILKGKVISIDPAEKLIEGVVYYEVNIAFDEAKEDVKPGMTADLVIKTASKSDVLIIPEDAVKEKEAKKMVRILKEGVIEEREIETGLVGSDDMVEIISGLVEGEKVIIKEK